MRIMEKKMETTIVGLKRGSGQTGLCPWVQGVGLRI